MAQKNDDASTSPMQKRAPRRPAKQVISEPERSPDPKFGDDLAELEKLKEESRLNLERRSRVADEQKRPEHSKAEDFRHAYIIDAVFLTRLSLDVEAIVGKPLKWNFRFVGEQTLSGSDVAEMLSQSVIQNREIETISASVSSYDELPLCNFKLSLGGLYRGAKADVTARDAAVFEQLRAIVREMLPASRQRRSWWVFSPYCSVALWFATLVLALIASTGLTDRYSLSVAESAVISGGIGGLFLAILFPLRSFLFRRVEFEIGYSIKMMEHRRWLRQIILWPFSIAVSGLLGNAFYSALTS